MLATDVPFNWFDKATENDAVCISCAGVDKERVRAKQPTPCYDIGLKPKASC